MRLIRRTYTAALKWLIPAMLVGSLYCYFMIEYVEHEETDEFLVYEMERLIDYHELYGNLPEFHKVSDILPDVHYDTPFFKDTLLLEPGDNEMVPYRELRFSIDHNNRYFTIVLRHLLLGEDDIIEGALMIVLGLFLIIILFVFLVLRTITGRLWSPFYQTLGTLVNYDIARPVPVFSETAITEFDQLNKVVTVLLTKISNDYRVNKEFNENISHELQTHLAIARSNAEKILNQWGDNTKGIAEIQKIYQSLGDLSRVQKSLSLLHKIENGEFRDRSEINLNTIVRHHLSGFSEIIEMAEIQLTVNTSSCKILMDKGLADILVTNLLKNAVNHNIRSGFMHVQLSDSELVIKNSGMEFTGNPKELMNRFRTGTFGGSGIGLSIVEQICRIYGFELSYQVEESTTHVVRVSFTPFEIQNISKIGS